MSTITGKVIVTTAAFLVLIIPISMNHVSPLLAQIEGTDAGEDATTSSAGQDYQDFQSCLSNAEVDGYVSEQQIRDCFAPIYNTGTGTAGDSTDTTTSTDSPSDDSEDTGSDADDTGSEDEEQGASSEE